MILDLFSGANGWGEGVRLLDLDAPDDEGIELNPVAAETARANGHRTRVADVTTVSPLEYAGRVSGSLGSPPCTTFSPAGKGEGRADLALILEAFAEIARGADPEAVAVRLRATVRNPSSALVVEPLRFALALRPEWLAWEQVPAVLPVWEVCAEILRAHGYSVWTGVLNAEQYGVPQTRRRALLIASLVREVAQPSPTHSRFYQRTPDRLDEGMRRWVSMADALGWDPADLVGFPRQDDGGASGAVTIDGVDYRARDLRSASLPAFALTEKARSWQRWGEGATIVYRNGNQARSARRPLEHPAPTVHFGARANKVEWMNAELARDPHASGRRVTVAEASTLQSFPPEYAWQGVRTARFLAVGNAVPPLLARAVVAEAAGLAVDLDVAA